MKVSIIVSVYNGADILPVTLPPLLNQDYPKEDIEIIIVDDCSADDSVGILKSKEYYEYIIVITQSENMGRAATRNSGIKVATGELLILIDCDIEIESDFISRHVKYHQNNNVVGVVSHLKTQNEKSRDKYHRYIFEGHRGAGIVDSDKPIPFKYFIQTCTSIKAHAINKTGKYNEKLPTYGIDLEYAYRLSKNFPKGLFYSNNIDVYMHKVKKLEEALTDFHKHGQFNVPIILKDYPELAVYVAADFVKSKNDKWTWKFFIGILLINPIFFKIAKWMLNITPFPLSNLLIRYLLAASVAMGYQNHLIKNL